MRFSKAVLSATIIAAMSTSGTAFAKPVNQHHLLKDLLKESRHTEVNTLADAARKARLLMGSAVSQSVLASGDTNYSATFLQEFDYLTPENSGKWGSLQSAPGVWDFNAHDELVDFAQENDKVFKGHTLVWHSQAPDFINDSLSASELQQLIDDHIYTTLSIYGGQFYGWDVVNEAIDEDGSYRDSVFYQKLGANYIADAFYLADQLDPKARLYYNDYNIAGINAKSDGVYNMLKGLVENGVPVDGIGFQMHLTAASAPSYDELVENFNRFVELGLTFNISELDVRVAELPWDQTGKLAIQRQIYHRVVSACLEFRECESVTTWGFTDAHSWVDSTFGADDPLQFDEAYNRKPAYYGLLDGLIGITPDDTNLPNLVDNGQFESGLADWSGWGATLERVSHRDTHRLDKLYWLNDRAKDKGHDRGKGHGHNRHDKKGKLQNWLAKKLKEKALAKAWRHRHIHPRHLRGHHNRYDHNVSEYGMSALLVTDRTDAWHSAAVDITSKLRGGTTYTASVDARLINADDELALSIHYQCTDEADVYLNLANEMVEAREWVTLSGEFEAPECEFTAASLYIEGPAAEVDYLVDNVSLRPHALVPDDTGLGTNIVANSGFETDASGWYGFGSATVEASDLFAASGNQSGYVTNRDATWQGPATSLLLDAEPGTDYQLLAWVRTESGSSTINATVKSSCPSGDTYTLTGSANANDSGWSIISGNFSVPDCDLSDLTIYFEGPAEGENFFIDEVYVRQVLESAIDNLVSNGGFESGISGWSAWGGTLSASSLHAHSGSQSALLSGRTANWQGPVYNLLPAVISGGYYEVSAWGRVAGTAAEVMNITLKTTCADGEVTYHQLDSTTVIDSEWTELSGNVVLPVCSLTEASLYFDGPSASADIFLDDVLVTGDANEEPGNLVTNPDFESGLNGWVSWGGNLGVTNEAHSGDQAAELTDRTGNWQGPVYNLLGAVEAGSTYDISAWVRVDGAASADMSITVKTTCDDGSEAYNWAGGATAYDTQWSEIIGSVTIPECNLTEVSLYFDGPDASINTLLDDVSVTPAL